MAITIGELIKNPKLIEQLRPPQLVCSCGCGLPFNSLEDLDREFPGPNGRLRADCYFFKLGEEIEQNPVVSGGIRRG